MVLSVNPAIMNNRVHLFCARKCRKVSGQELDGAEDIEVTLMDRAEVLQGLKKRDHSPFHSSDRPPPVLFHD